MTLPFFVDSAILAVDGQVRTTQSKYSPESIIDTLWECRQIQMQQAYRASHRIQPVWTQRYIPDFDKDLQDENGVLKFKIPPVVQLDEQTLGFLYMGSEKCLKQYRLFRNRAEYATYKRHRVQRESTIPVVIYSDGILEIHNTKLSKIDLEMDSVFYRPTDVPTFNPEYSEIPLDGDNLSRARQMVIATMLKGEMDTPARINPNLMKQ